MTLNKTFVLAGLILLKPAAFAGAAVVVDANWTVNSPIPDNGAVGFTTYQSFTGLSENPISDVVVNLDISGGFNGALYGYLTLQDANGNTGTEILLDQIGVSPSNPIGSSGSGLNVTLSDAGVVNGNIHNATGNPVGIWQPDSVSSLDGAFGGLDANGTWTLFLVDKFSTGDAAILDSWGLDISVTAIPEPPTIALLMSGGGIAAFVLSRSRLRGFKFQSK